MGSSVFYSYTTVTESSLWAKRNESMVRFSLNNHYKFQLTMI